MHEKTVLNRPLRRRMGMPQRTFTRSRKRGASSGPQLAQDPKRYLLHPQKWLRLAAFASRLPTLEDRLSLLQSLAPERNLGEKARRFACTGAGSHREEPPAQREHLDSQSVRTTGVGGEDRGYDGGKKVKGRKRHLLVDTQGLVLKANVHSAGTRLYFG
jgi:hypothetical protein